MGCSECRSEFQRRADWKKKYFVYLAEIGLERSKLKGFRVACAFLSFENDKNNSDRGGKDNSEKGG